MRLSVPIVGGGAAARRGHRTTWIAPARHASVPGLGSLVDAAWAAPAGPAPERQQTLLADLAARDDEMLALSVALPFCAVHCLSCGRDVAAGQSPQVLDGYMQHPYQEIDNLAGRIGGRRAAAEHLLCHQQLPAALLAGDLAPVYEALASLAPPGCLCRLADRLVVTAPGRLDLHHLCAALAGLPADVQPPLPAWLA